VVRQDLIADEAIRSCPRRIARAFDRDPAALRERPLAEWRRGKEEDGVPRVRDDRPHELGEQSETVRDHAVRVKSREVVEYHLEPLAKARDRLVDHLLRRPCHPPFVHRHREERCPVRMAVGSRALGVVARVMPVVAVSLQSVLFCESDRRR
jgi:hypothetical protein